MQTNVMLKKTNKLKLLSLLSEACELTPSLILPIFLILIAPITLVFILAFFGLGAAISTGNILIAGPIMVLALVFCLVFPIFVAPITIMLGIRKAVNLSIDIKTVFLQCMRVKRNLFFICVIYLLIAYLFSAIKPQYIRFDLMSYLFRLVIDMLFFFCTLPLFLFAMPLIIIKHCQLSAAINSAYQKMYEYALPLVPYYLFMIAIVYFAYLVFFTGFLAIGPTSLNYMKMLALSSLLWLLPMQIALVGIVFRQAYGLRKYAENREK